MAEPRATVRTRATQEVAHDRARSAARRRPVVVCGAPRGHAAVRSAEGASAGAEVERTKRGCAGRGRVEGLRERPDPLHDDEVRRRSALLPAYGKEWAQPR